MANKSKTISSSVVEYYTLKLYLEETGVSLENNTSNVKYKLTLHSGNTNFDLWKIGWTIKLNNKRISYQAVDSAEQRSLDENSSITIVEGTTTVEHNADGSLDMSAYAILDFTSDTSYIPDGIDLSGNLTLSTLSRGMVYIYNGSEYAAYQCYIYNGSDWELYLPHIYDGTNWDSCS